MKKNEQTTPRGIRNNNPLNIRRTQTTTWWGQKTENLKDPAFCEFTEMKYGYRAAFRLLMKYYRKYGLHSVQAIINRWAPPSDGNATNAYVKQVVAALDVNLAGGHRFLAAADCWHLECARLANVVNNSCDSHN